jgi:hypothetical protein
MKTPDALKSLTARDIEHIVLKSQGRNDLRNVLGVGGLYGRAVSAADERCAAAALQGLADGWLELDSQAVYYTGEEQIWYLAARASGSAALPIAPASLVCQERAA